MRIIHIAAALGGMGLGAAGCGWIGPAAAGQTQVIHLGSVGSLELYVPDGWYLDSMTSTGTVASSSNLVYVLADRERLPAEILTGGAEDARLREEFTRQAADGAAIGATLTPAGPCSILEAEQSERDREYRADGARFESVDGVLGGTASLVAWQAADGDLEPGRPPAMVLVDAVVPLGDGECGGLTLRKSSSADRLEADKRQLTTIAQKSALVRG